MNKGLTMKTGQTHMQRYMKPLLKKIESAPLTRHLSSPTA